MAVNRFWGETPVAQYTPMARETFQEMAYGPQIMYQREQDAISKLDAMNEAKNTLTSVLGENAGKTEQFNQKYASALAALQKEGATQRNIDELRKVKELYASEVKPQEMFLTDREKKAEMYYKAKADANNILLGADPTKVKYDDYRRDPSSMEFSVLGRDKLFTYGQQGAKDIKAAFTKQYPDKYGFMHVQEGFSNPAEAMDAYAKNVNGFKDRVEQKVKELSSANGAAGNPIVEDVVRQGLINGVVGEHKMMGIPGWGEMMRNSGQTEAVPAVSPYITKDPQASPSDKSFDIAASMPHMKAALNNSVLERKDLVSKGITSIDKLNEVIARLESESNITEPVKSAKGFVDTAAAIVQSADRALNVPFEYMTGEHKDKAYNGIKLSDLKDIRDKINQGLMGTSEYATDMLIKPNRELIALDAKLDPRIKSSIDAAEQDLAGLIDNYVRDDIGTYGATKESDLEAMKAFSKAPKSKRHVVFDGIRVNSGTGFPTVVATLVDETAKKGSPEEKVALHLPAGETLRLMTAIRALGQGDPEIDQYIAKMSEYYKHAAKFPSK